jgi:hypothetical protein
MLKQVGNKRKRGGKSPFAVWMANEKKYDHDT